MIDKLAAFNTFLTTQLNPEQQVAVQHKNGVLVVRAGAGSGKTRIITARMTYLILEAQVTPESIIALTFTNKAAREMKERMERFLSTRLPYVGTFHSYCLRLLKTSPQFFDNSFSILDETDQQQLIKGILQRFKLEKKITPRAVIYSISQYKNSKAITTQHEPLLDPLIKQLYYLYEQEKAQSHALDFDDLLLEVLKLFKSSSAFKQVFQQTVRHILVDEYQDTNTVQHELLKEMAQTPDKALAIDSVCVVGDEDQSIYSWRGATITNILNFSRDFPLTQHVTIEQNYRSVQPILDVANNIIARNGQRKPKNLWSTRSATDRVRVLHCASEYHEAEAIALGLKQISRTEPLEETAILYRSHYQSRPLEEAFIRHAIPYTVIGGIQFYERQEIKDLLAYLRLIVNPFDRIAFLRVINCPARGLGDKFQELFINTWNKQPLFDFKSVARLLLDTTQLTPLKARALEDFLALYNILDFTMLPSTALELILKNTQYLEYLKKNFDEDESVTKIENVKELAQAIAFFEMQGLISLDRFLDEVSLMQEATTKNDTNNSVKLMTVHAAKGLEFNTVIVAGLEEGIFPSGYAIQEDDRIEEERRLLYVAITRAKERLLLTHARYRYTWGQLSSQEPSRFLEELPRAHLQKHDGSYWSAAQWLSYFSQWLYSS